MQDVVVYVYHYRDRHDAGRSCVRHHSKAIIKEEEEEEEKEDQGQSIN